MRFLNSSDSQTRMEKRTRKKYKKKREERERPNIRIITFAEASDSPFVPMPRTSNLLGFYCMPTFQSASINILYRTKQLDEYESKRVTIICVTNDQTKKRLRIKDRKK